MGAKKAGDTSASYSNGNFVTTVALCLFSVPGLNRGQDCCHECLMNGTHLMVEMNGASKH
jgi:hypothetical protein